jgi:hypothetical protein
MSTNKITYLDQIIPNKFFVFSNPELLVMDSFGFSDIKFFIDSLESDKAYVVTFEFVTSWILYEEDSPSIILSKPILITKNSNPITITQFIYYQIGLAIGNYNLDDDILEKIGETEGPGIIAKYNEINLF